MVDHVFSLYETLTQIPLIIRHPLRFAADTVDQRRVQLTDLFPTILDCAGIDTGKYPSQGRNLLDKTFSSEDGVVICEYDYPLQAINAFAPQDRDNSALEPYRRDLKSVTMNGRKLIWASDGKHELYDLERDPNETKNLIDSEAFRKIRLLLARRLERAVAQSVQMRAAGSATPTDTLDEDTREALRALGYLD
jgi:arylsulfatase A-like enzyme